MEIKPDLKGVIETLDTYVFPQDIIIEVTRHCNLKCIICPYPNLIRPFGEMDFSLYKKIVDEIERENPSSRIWLAIMGEPLLMKDRLLPFIEYAKNKGIHINLNTNGVFLDDGIAAKLIELKINKVLISIDAFSEEAYNKIRIGGNFNKVVANTANLIKLAAKYNVTEVIAQFIEMEENEGETSLFKEFWLEKGAVVKLRPKLGWGKSFKSEVLLTAESEITRFPCSWLNRTLSVHHTGNVAQCDADFEGVFSAGNLNTQSIKEIWNNELKKRRERHWAKDFNFEPCVDCKDWLAGRSYFFYPNK